MPKIKEKEQAVLLRKQGKTYDEILKEVDVARSTLSLWLRDVGLGKKQYQRITERKKAAQRTGALAHKNKRITSQEKIYAQARAEIGDISKRELWLIGIALYWAEGKKEKESRPGHGMEFINSDPRMIRVFLRWLQECCGVTLAGISFSIYIHESHKDKLDLIRTFWSEKTELPIFLFTKCYFKKHNIKTKRKNVGDLYNGLLRVRVCRSSVLHRKITGWIQGIS
jgi:hypothetical protein